MESPKFSSMRREEEAVAVVVPDRLGPAVVEAPEVNTASER